MYKVINPIEINPIYELDLEENNDTGPLQKVIHFLQDKPNLLDNQIFYFMKENGETLQYMLKLLPFSVILKLYQEYNWLKHYWSQEILENIIFLSKMRFYTHYYNGEYEMAKRELIILNNQINRNINFNLVIFKRRISFLQYFFPSVNFNDFIFGGNAILYLGSKGIKLKTITLYPKTFKFSFTNKICKDEMANLYIKGINLTIKINNGYPKNPLDLIVNGLESCIYDGENILCTPDFYQNLEDMKPQEMVHVELEPYPYLTKVVKQIKVNKHLINENIGLNMCYRCKKFYNQSIIIDRYIDFCLTCGLFNYEKREDHVDLKDKVAFVTGIRQKIGLSIALKLLRCGAKVIGTTRFPQFTWYNYAKQPDFDEWKDKLVIYKCDFLNINKVHEMIVYLKTHNISIIINNACQTIKASPIYYEKLTCVEESIKCLTYEGNISTEANITGDELIQIGKVIEFNNFDDVLDIPIKDQSSWVKHIGDIDPGEIMEATVINQMVPTLIINSLKNELVGDKFIINVTCLEGTFNCNKTGAHPHTNMCKAAMNMLIRTLFEEGDLNVYSIDPGFVSGVNPQMNHYPLSTDDASAQILYPIIQFYKGKRLPKSIEWCHIRGYQPTAW